MASSALNQGASHWYKFTYHYDNSKNDNEPTEALVLLKMSMPGAVSFSIETPGNLALPKKTRTAICVAQSAWAHR